MIRISCPNPSVRDILTDITIQTEFGQYRAHKIFLAKYSKKIREDLKHSNSNVYEMLEISKNAFQVIIDAIYNNYFRISRSNVHSILYITSHYKFEQFKYLTLVFIQEILDAISDWSELSEFLQQFTDACYIDDIVNIFAQKIARFYTTNQKIDEILSISQFPKIFSYVLLELKEKNDLTSLQVLKYLAEATIYFKNKETVKIDKDCTYPKGSKIEQLILLNFKEKYEAIHRIEDLYNKELIDLKDNDVISYIIYYKIDIIPDVLMKPILKEIFQRIRNNSKKFEEYSNKVKSKTVSKWFPFAWLSRFMGSELNSVPKIKLFKFLQTLDGLSEKYINYSSFGFFNVQRQPNIDLDFFDESNAFVDNETPFLAIQQSSGERVSLDIDLGRSAKFVPEKIFIDLNVKSRICPTSSTDNRLQPAPSHIYMKIDDKNEFKFEVKENIVSLDRRTVKFERKGKLDDNKEIQDRMEKDFEKKFGFRKLSIYPPPDTTVFRIRYIEIEGYFCDSF